MRTGRLKIRQDFRSERRKFIQFDSLTRLKPPNGSIFYRRARLGHTSRGCGDSDYWRSDPWAGEPCNTGLVRQAWRGFTGCVRSGDKPTGRIRSVPSYPISRQLYAINPLPELVVPWAAATPASLTRTNSHQPQLNLRKGYPFLWQWPRSRTAQRTRRGSLPN